MSGFCQKNFPGYQALVVTHTDVHNGSGNIHTHIVINSVRKYAVDRQEYMDKQKGQKENQAYAWKVKISNLQEMADTLE